jgi:hypothetical protein
MSALARRGFRRLLLGSSLSYFGDSALTLWAVASLIYMVPVIAVALGALFIFGMAVPNHTK